MNFKKLVLSFCCLIITYTTFSQKTEIYTNELKNYNSAVALYLDHSYLAAQNAFSAIVNSFDDTTEHKGNCKYYIANCAIKLDQQNADLLMQDFVKKHPTNTKRNSAYLETANYYYTTEKYPEAVKWYQQVQTTNLSTNKKEDLTFNLGYSLYTSGKQEDSKKYFKELLKSDKYSSKAKYYYGYIAYTNDDYTTADEYLGQVADDKSYTENISYSLADINFKLGKFEKAIAIGTPLLTKSKGDEHSQISKIIGESYFNLKEYKEATPHLKNYKGTDGKWNNTDYYMLGYTYYKQEDYKNAISNLNKIIDGNDDVSQNAYYHLGECYLKLNQKPQALNAFKNASQMEFNLKIQEDASVNYLKLSYDIGNPYKSVPDIALDFLSKYPNSPYKERINQLLVNSYIRAQEYQGAISYIENKKQQNTHPLYQKASFLRGVELFNEENYEGAIENFNKAETNPIDYLLEARTLYWLGESYFRINKFNKALNNFNAFIKHTEANRTDEFENIYYNKAYTFFKLKEYAEAKEQFKQYINTKPKNKIKLNDSYLRLADTYFVTSDYKNAISNYERIANTDSPEADYAQFQKAISYGYLKQDPKKINELKAFTKKFPKSRYNDQAYYSLGNEYVELNKNTEAIKYYDYLINNYNRSGLRAKALLKKGIIYYNTDKNDKALNAYKSVVKNYPNSAEAHQAVQSARQIYLDIGKIDEYAIWAKTIDFINITDADIDNDMYASAEKQYLKSEHDKAIEGFNKYLSNFPKGLHKVQANFYLAESLFSKKEYKKTVPHYKFIINQEQNEFSERALFHLSKVYLETENWNDAIPLLIQLENQSIDTQNRLFAQSNLMKGFYKNEKYEEAVEYADKVLSQPKIDNVVKSDGEIIIARAAIKTNNEAKARSSYARVQKVATGERMAEALYYDAYFKRKDKQYEASNTVIQKIASEYSIYKYWGGKSLILMAENSYDLNDSFQATYILESVIKNFAQFDDIVKEAKTVLNNFKIEEAKTNESVTPVE